MAESKAKDVAKAVGLADAPKRAPSAGRRAMSRSYQCACKQVTVEVEGKEMFSAYCHCSQCRRTCSAPYFHGAGFKPSQIKVSGGELGGFAINKMNRKFCKNCGTYMLGDAGEVNIVPASLLDFIGQSDTRPKALFHIETGNCCLPLGLPDDGLPKYLGQPDGPLDVTTKVAKQGPFTIAGAGSVDCCASTPDSYSEIAKNDVGRLIKMTLAAGATDNPHDHPLAHYLYIIKGGKLKLDMPEGKSMEIEVKPGMAMPVPGGTHQVSNVGTTDVEIIFMEPTGVNTATPDGHTSPFTTDPDCYKLLCEDDNWFVGEMTMKPGAKDHPHSHRDHLLYVLGGEKIIIYPGKVQGDAKLELPLAPGAALGVPQGWHVVENVGAQEVKIIFWEIKK